MRRADRLFQIVQYLRNRKLTTARWLAEKLGVSERTVYRDIQDLVLSGVPLEGEAGVGYMLRQGLEIPPLMFTPEEIEALVVGARMVRSWTGDKLSRAAEQALSKIQGALPKGLKSEIERSRLFAPEFPFNERHRELMDLIRLSIHDRRILRFDYEKEDGRKSKRSVRPLGLYFWGRVWTLVAWCELRKDFRQFRVDRVKAAKPLGRQFQETVGQTLADYIRCIREAEDAWE